jgi:uncharacterized damage-inducible protein DinB
MRTRVDELMQELEQEADATRRVLARVPDSHLSWKPHEKSFSLGQLALHVATIPGFIATMAMRSPFPVPQFAQAEPASAGELLTAFEASLSTARDVLSAMTDAQLADVWRLVDGDREMIAMPVGAVLRTIMLNHWYHHRGQLLVYLRQVGQPLPSVYGPTADENPFVQAATAAIG